MLYYHLLDKNNKVILSDLPDKLLGNYENCKSSSEKLRLGGKPCRQGKIEVEKIGTAYIITTNADEINSSRIFNSKLTLYSQFINEVIDIKSKIVNKVLHDLTKLNGYCIQEMFELVPDDVVKTKTYKKQISKLEKHLCSNSRNISKSIFKLYRAVLHIKTECSKLKYLYSKNVTIDKDLHLISNAIKPSLHIYIPHLQAKKVKVEVDENFTKEVNLNFEFFEAALVPLLDNIQKYILHDSTLSIYFADTFDGFAMNFDMISMAIKESEKDKILQDGVSGENAIKNKLNGKGIGMTSIINSLEINNAEMRININVNRKREKRYNNTNYERNVFQIVFLNQ